MNPKLILLLAWLTPTLLIAFGLMRDFTLFHIQLPLGSPIAVSFEQFNILSSITVLFIRNGGGR